MLNEEKLLGLLDEDKKNLFCMDVINAASIFIGAYEDERKLADLINSGEFLPRIVNTLGETNSKLCKEYDLEDVMADKLLGSEEERLEYLSSIKPFSWIVSHKLTRGMKLTDDELKFVKTALENFEHNLAIRTSDDQTHQKKEDDELPWD